MNDTDAVAQPVQPTKADLWEFLRAVLGNSILLLLLVGAEHLFLGSGFYSSLIQHPFWIIVLIAAVHDGLFVGVMTAVAATLLMDWPPRPAEADITAHYIQVAILPLQWLFAALCIGMFRQMELRRAIAAAAEGERLQQVNEVLAADLQNLEAQMTAAQLKILMREGTRDRQDKLVSRVLALQEADLSNLGPLFSAVAELCTPLPAIVLFKNGEGGLEPLDAEQASNHFYASTPLDIEQLQKLRTMQEILIHRTTLFEQQPEYVLLVGITSPDRRTLHGAVALLANDSKSAEHAGDSAKFLASQLVSVLARIRVPAIVASAEAASRDVRVRQLSHG